MPAIWSTSMEMPPPELFCSMLVLSSVVAAEPLAAPALEGAVQDVSPGLLAQPDQEPDVMNRDQPQSQHVFDHEEVPEIASRIRGAGLTVTGGIERLGRAFQPRPPHINSAVRQPGGRAPARGGGPRGRAVAGGSNAVEEIDSPRNSLQQIGRKANSHKITGDLYGQCRLQEFENVMHHRLRLSHRQTSDGNAGPGSTVERALERAHAQLVVDAALHDGPESLRR